MSVFVNGARWFNGLFTGVLNWNPTANHVITLPPLSGMVALDGQPVGVGGAGVSLRGYEPILTVAAPKILGLTDAGTVQNCTGAGSTVITVPLNSAVAFPIGTRIIVRKTTVAAVDLGYSVGVSILSETGAVLTAGSDGLAVVGFLILRKTAVDTWVVENPLPVNVFLRGQPTTVTQLLLLAM